MQDRGGVGKTSYSFERNLGPKKGCGGKKRNYFLRKRADGKEAGSEGDRHGRAKKGRRG